jgi:hypothetical protein
MGGKLSRAWRAAARRAERDGTLGAEALFFFACDSHRGCAAGQVQNEPARRKARFQCQGHRPFDANNPYLAQVAPAPTTQRVVYVANFIRVKFAGQ